MLATSCPESSIFSKFKFDVHVLASSINLSPDLKFKVGYATVMAMERYKLATASSTKHRPLIGTEMKISVSKSLDQADVESFVYDGGVENLEFDISKESKNNTNLYFAATGHGCASVEVCSNFSRGHSELNFVILRSKRG